MAAREGERRRPWLQLAREGEVSGVPIETLSYIFIVEPSIGLRSRPIWAKAFVRGG